MAELALEWKHWMKTPQEIFWNWVVLNLFNLLLACQSFQQRVQLISCLVRDRQICRRKTQPLRGDPLVPATLIFSSAVLHKLCKNWRMKEKCLMQFMSGMSWIFYLLFVLLFFKGNHACKWPGPFSLRMTSQRIVMWFTVKIL